MRDSKICLDSILSGNAPDSISQTERVGPYSGPNPVGSLCRKRGELRRTLFRFSIASDSFFVDGEESGPHLFC